MKKLLLLLGCIGLFSCSQKTANVESAQQDFLLRLEREKKAFEFNQKMHMLLANSAGVPQDYLIGPGDVLSINVFQVEALNTTTMVTSTGTIRMPLIGEVKVGNKSVREVEDTIRESLRKYIVDPQVTVFIKEFVSRRVSVIGQVKEPRIYEIKGRYTLLEALSAAKGLTENAAMSVHLSRRNLDGTINSMIIDLEELLVKGDLSLNVTLQDGDVIFVPEAGTFFVEGAVRNPGSFKIKTTMTLSKALALAGGLRDYADQSRIKLIRVLNEGKRIVREYNYNDVVLGRQEDPVIEDRDVIVVNTSGLKEFLYGIRLGIGFGLINIGYQQPYLMR